MVKKAQLTDAALLGRLSVQLWPHNAAEEMTQEFRQLLQDSQCGLFLAFHGVRPIGFAQCQLRHDYVEGTQTSPVGYLEGIYVETEYRRKGYAQALLSACENWAREKGCTEFASDCELENRGSLAFHLKLGFREANRIICFTKKL